MFRILVASAKGGVGKTTIATTLAGHYALAGKRTALIDADPQGSSLSWCGKRQVDVGRVLAVDGTRRNAPQRIPEKAQRVVIDAPAGAMPRDLSGFIDIADAMVVPVLPSVLDMEATVRFLNALADVPRVASGKLPVGLVANRLKPRTQASQQVVEQLSQWPVALVAHLRDTQAYVLLSGLGKCLFDYHSESVRDHQKDWEPLLQWLRRIRKRG
ncbi:ParA family protein [Xanthomonadaceae bacterium JHOS43]|nr:ParA family protein [Xanthomonadaceae bacterium JHOS43]MCX7562398.1 ParA family protein [Xanthomonadaceae bacterium XH05]